MVGTSALALSSERNWPTELLRAAARTPLPTEDTKLSAAAAANAVAEWKAAGNRAIARKLRRENVNLLTLRIISSSSKGFDCRHHGGRRETRNTRNGFAGDIAIRDFGLPHLSINIADARIEIRRCLSQGRIIVENRFTPGHQLNCRRRQTFLKRRIKQNPCQRIDGGIDQLSGRIARIGWSEYRQHHIRSRPRTPHREGLPEILRMI